MKKQLQKYMPILIILGIVVVGLIGLFIYSAFAMNVDKLIAKNFGDNSYFATAQKMSVEITLPNNSKINYLAENRRDSDTDHIKVNNGNGSTSEYYVAPIDLKYGLYSLKDNKWYLKLKSKTISLDDSRTDFVESNNEISFNSISATSFKNAKMTKNNGTNEYVIQCQTDYVTMAVIIGNLRQVIWEFPYNTEIVTYLMDNADKLTFDTMMTFDAKTKALKKVTFSINQEILATMETKVFNNLVITLENTSYDISNIFIPQDIELNAIKLDDKQNVTVQKPNSDSSGENDIKEEQSTEIQIDSVK